MNQKVLRIVPFIVAILLVSDFAAGDVAAASESTSAQLTKVNVRETIALNVTPTYIIMTIDGVNNPLAGDTAYSGAGSNNDNINVKNVGNVPINVLIRICKYSIFSWRP